MKELIKESPAINISEFTSKLTQVSGHIGIGILGFFMAKTSLWGGISPLGTALAAGVPLLYTPATCIGTLLGYIISPNITSGLKYAAALLAIVVIRFIFGKLHRSRIPGITWFLFKIP